MKGVFVCLVLMLALSCSDSSLNNSNSKSIDKKIMKSNFELSLAQANKLSTLPIKCIQTEYPNKLGQVLGTVNDLESPKALHPAFYGCFDWHSAVHGHWSLVKLLKEYANLDNADQIREMLTENMTAENISIEVAYFKKKYNKSYERTYGWAWLLKLAVELETWDDPLAKKLNANLMPLTELIAQKYIDFLPNLRYPIRAGTHSNTGFGLAFAWDYAVLKNNKQLQAVIRDKAKEFYLNDANCPLTWEPSGTDFLSPCLEEIDIMRRVLSKVAFKEWVSNFMPTLESSQFSMAVGEVLDRTDGHFVHLDGLNLSRAWVMYGLANQYEEYNHLIALADKHIEYSLPLLFDGNYEGEHWLASFAIYALSQSN